jgi:hypothetical protein
MPMTPSMSSALRAGGRYDPFVDATLSIAIKSAAAS